MHQDNKKIPIVVLTKDEPIALKAMVRAIQRRTKYPYHLFIVDNYSKNIDQKHLLKNLNKQPNIEVIFNKRNQWILGFNKAIEKIKLNTDFNQTYYVFSDGDIIVPIIKGGICWLTYLKRQMDKKIVLGKLGLSLDITMIKNKSFLGKTYYREKTIMEGPRLDDVILAPVDTTIAIYRSDLFITDSLKFLPGHMSLVKPYYYVARTNNDWRCKHLGWRTYQNLNMEQIKDKVICFTRYTGYIDPVVLKKLPFTLKMYYKTIGKLYKVLWGSLLVYYWIRFIAFHFPRDLNEIMRDLRR